MKKFVKKTIELKGDIIKFQVYTPDTITINSNKKDFIVTGLLFFFTGLAIVLYLNQVSLQPRERDYAYVGSFYVFAIWIGLGVLHLTVVECFSRMVHPQFLI
jgi:hypothetical protein